MSDPRSPLTWLATLGEQDLTELLTVRADPIARPVHDLADLAARLVDQRGVWQALAHAPAPVLQVLEVVALLADGATVRRVAALLDDTGDTHLDEVRDVVGQLVRRALVWSVGSASLDPGDDDPLVVNPGLRAVFPDPLGLGRRAAEIAAEQNVDSLRRVLRGWGVPVPRRKAEMLEALVAHLSDPAHVRRVLATAPAAVVHSVLRAAERRVATARRESLRERLDLDGYGQVGVGHAGTLGPASPSTYAAERAAARWAEVNGLAFPGWQGTQMPAEVALALAGPDVRFPFTSRPVVPATVEVAPEHAERAGAAALSQTLATTGVILERVARQPLAALRAGGVGVRELARLAKSVGVTTADVRLALELAAACGLLEIREDGLGTSAEFERWRRRPPGERATDLVTSWYTLPVVATIEAGEDGKGVPALVRRAEADVVGRVVSIHLVAELPERTGIAVAEDLVAVARWASPLVDVDADALRATWAEAERLGVVAHGRLTAVGAALDSRDEAAIAAAATAMVPQAQGKVLLGSDLTVVVAGSPAAEVVDLLDAVADRESHGTASTWRLAPATVRRALDDGWAVDDLRAALRAAAGADLPQAMDYLLADVGGRHGRVGVRPALAVVVGEDAALLAEIAAHRALARLDLHAVAPTVLVTARAGRVDVVEALRKAGYMPAVLEADGEVVVRRRGSAAPDERGVDGEAVGTGRDGVVDEIRAWMDEVGIESPESVIEVEEPAAAARRLLAGDPPASSCRGEHPEGGKAGGGGRASSGIDLEAIEDLVQAAPDLSPRQALLLLRAEEQGERVWIRYRAKSGPVTERVVSGLELEPPLVYAWCELRQDERVFTLTRVLDVRPMR